jgi:hypothetical protein
VKNNLGMIDAVREGWRRSGGKLPRLGQAELAALYLKRLGDIGSLTAFKQADLDLAGALEALSPRLERARYDALPTKTTVRDREVEIDYDVEESGVVPLGVARLRLPEKVARSLTEGEVPRLDRPVRFVVARGQRGSVRARTLDELQTLLDAPWSEEEVARFNRKRDEQREANRERSRGRAAHGAKRGLREEQPRGQRPGRRERSRKKDPNERESYIGVPLPGDAPPAAGAAGSGAPHGPRRGPNPGGARGGGRPGGRGGGRGRSR